MSFYSSFSRSLATDILFFSDPKQNVIFLHPSTVVHFLLFCFDFRFVFPLIFCSFSETKCNFLHPPTSVYFLSFWFDFRCVFRFCDAREQYVSLCTAPARHKIWLAFYSICQLTIEKLSIWSFLLILSFLCNF